MDMLYYSVFFFLVGYIYEIGAQYIPHTICAQALLGACRPVCDPGESEVTSTFPDICRGVGGVCCNLDIEDAPCRPSSSTRQVEDVDGLPIPTAHWRFSSATGRRFASGFHRLVCGGQTSGAWSTWSSCSVTCGEGERTRNRTCVSGVCLQKELCSSNQCLTVTSTWGKWGAWSSCADNCQGFRRRTRTCSDNRCVGPRFQQDVCYNDVACQGGSDCGQVAARALGVDIVKSCGTIPWVVVFEYVDTSINLRMPICSGVMLSSTKVLTTAQCVSKRELQASIEVVAGSYPRGSQSRVIADVLVLPQTQENTVTDIAIVTVTEAFTENVCATAVCLPDPSDVFDGSSRCVLSGWGIESAKSGYVAHKQRIANVSLLSTSMCRYIYSYMNPSQIIHDDTLCTDPSRHNVTLCQDDRGWMLACDDSKGRSTLVGLYSAVGSHPCNPNSPSIFQAVTSHMTWILQQLSPPLF